MKNKAFTLVELLVVMSIIGVLVSLAGISFRSSQIKGRDTARKSDLREIANSLEIFYGDHNQYPPEINGQIAACPFDTLTDTGQPCDFGTSEFTDGNTVYFKTLPKDTSKAQTYYYQASPNNQKFQLFTHLENLKDRHCLSQDCENPGVTVSCGNALCNFAIVSSNTTPFE